MKRLIVFLTISFLVIGIFCIPVQSQETYNKKSFEYRLPICVKLEKFARATMRYRQAGASLTEMLKKIEETNMSDRGKNLCRVIALMAYEVPQYMTKEFRQQAVKQFGNTVSYECLSGHYLLDENN